MKNRFAIVAVVISALSMGLTVTGYAAPPVKTVTAPTPLVYVDSTGKVVGRAVPVFGGGRTGVAIAIGTGTYVVTLDAVIVGDSYDYTKATWWQYDGRNFGYSGLNCSGVAYMAPSTGLLGTSVATLAVRGSSATLYTSSSTASAKYPVQSFQSQETCTNNITPQIFNGVPMGAPIDLTTMFTPPFTIQ